MGPHGTGQTAGRQGPQADQPDDEHLERPRRFWSYISKPVFIPASIIIFGLIAFASFAATDSERIFGSINSVVTDTIGWWYIVVVSLFVLFAFYVAITRMGNIKLGADDDTPEFSIVAWFAMLFSAGMGIGLVFWGVAEPLNHFLNPPSIHGQVAEGIAAADLAMDLTMFHWGLHAWAVYVVVGLGMAYMTHRRGRPLSLRWLLEPLLGKQRVEGPIGHAVDVIAVVGTLFGVATSLGLGVQQILAGMTFLGWVENPGNVWFVIIIGVITGIATFSVVSGVHKGLKWLSNINMGLAFSLLLFVLFAGPTLLLLNAWIHNLGGYFSSLPEAMLRTTPLDGELEGDTWINSWTIFYWGWWMSWAPFVGMFIARISKGRTIREFVLGVLLAPTLVSSLWFTVFGESAILRQLVTGDMAPQGVVDTSTSLFTLLEGLPWSTLTSIVAILVIALFFITSSDSGSLVIDMLASGGRTDTPAATRVYWAVLEGLAAAVLLIAGGSAALIALQTAAIVTAVPVSIVMAVAAVSLLRAFRYEVATTANYLRIVGSSADMPLEITTSDQDGHFEEEQEMVVAVHNLRPAAVEVDEGTSTIQLAPEPYGEDPLAPEAEPAFAAPSGAGAPSRDANQ